MDDTGTLVTYRYIRLAMVALVVGIAVALVEQRMHATAFQGSISSYYYTPARGVFVAALFGIGVCLICVRGGTVLEDSLLNVAGMLGMVVALVPTPPDDPSRNADRLSAIRNNFPALLWVGVFAMVVLLVVFVAGRRGERKPPTKASRAGWISALVAGALLLAAYVWYRHWNPGFLAWAHLTAAIAMFAMIGFVAVSDGIQTVLEPSTRLRGWLYVAIGAAMGLGGIGIYVANSISPWKQAMLHAEALLIILFAVLWAVQTIDLWDYTDRKQANLARAARRNG